MMSLTGCRDPNRDLHRLEYDKSGALRVSLETTLVLVVISKENFSVGTAIVRREFRHRHHILSLCSPINGRHKRSHPRVVILK